MARNSQGNAWIPPELRDEVRTYLIVGNENDADYPNVENDVFIGGPSVGDIWRCSPTKIVYDKIGTLSNT